MTTEVSEMAMRQILARRNIVKRLKTTTVCKEKGTIVMNRKGKAKKMYDRMMSMLAFMSGILGSSGGCLAQDKITISYNVHCDVNRSNIIRESTMGVNYTLEWKRQKVVVTDYPEECKKLTLKPELRKSMVDATRGGNYDLRCAGFAHHDARNCRPNESRKVIECLISGSKGHNVFTRLVKGYLHMIYAREVESIRLNDQVPNIEYTVSNVAREYNVADKEYIYVSDEDTLAYAGPLYLMCAEYPYGMYGYQHIEIPGDNNINIVSKSERNRLDLIGPVSHVKIEAAILKYAQEMQLLDQLGEAYMVACMLVENRYLTKVALPAVRSRAELVAPALASLSLPTERKVIMTKEQERVVGRCLNASACILAKDVVRSYRNTTTEVIGFEECKNYMFEKEEELLSKLGGTDDGGMLSSCTKMRWLSEMDEDDCDRVDNINIFECGWVITDQMEPLLHGVVAEMKQGKLRPVANRRDGLGMLERYDALTDEINKAGGNIDISGDARAPYGDYIIDYCFMTSQRNKSYIEKVSVEEVTDVKMNDIVDKFIQSKTDTTNASNLSSKVGAIRVVEEPVSKQKRVTIVENDKDTSSTRSSKEDRVKENVASNRPEPIEDWSAGDDEYVEGDDDLEPIMIPSPTSVVNWQTKLIRNIKLNELTAKDAMLVKIVNANVESSIKTKYGWSRCLKELRKDPNLIKKSRHETWFNVTYDESIKWHRMHVIMTAKKLSDRCIENMSDSEKYYWTGTAKRGEESYFKDFKYIQDYPDSNFVRRYANIRNCDTHHRRMLMYGWSDKVIEMMIDEVPELEFTEAELYIGNEQCDKWISRYTHLKKWTGAKSGISTSLDMKADDADDDGVNMSRGVCAKWSILQYQKMTESEANSILKLEFNDSKLAKEYNEVIDKAKKTIGI